MIIMEFPSFFVLRQSGYRANGDLRASVLHSLPVSFPSFTSGVFVSVSRCRSQTADRRWVWRVIPLHLSINPETISSVPLQNVKASLRRWVHHLLSQVFPSSSHQKHINTSCAITFYCPFFPPSVGGGPTAPPECGRVWDQKKCKKKKKNSWKRKCLKSTGGDRTASLSQTSPCISCNGTCATDLLSNWNGDT